MYRFSRAIYLETRELLARTNPVEMAEARKRVLASCEDTMEKLAKDPAYYPDPAKALFSDIRYYFPIRNQERVYHVIHHFVTGALSFLEEERANSTTEGAMLRCRAQTRRGKPCQRTPLPDMVFCPSHQHMAAEVAAS